MLRKTLTILSLIGLLLSVGLWGVSYFDFIYEEKYQVLRLHSGCIEWTRRNTSNASKMQDWIDNKGLGYYYPRRLMTTSRIAGREYPVLAFGGFNGLGTIWRPQHRMIAARFVRSRLPLWMPTVAFGLALLLCRPLHFHRRRKRKKFGLCVKCGYDLRESKERCPECGEEFQS